MLDKARYHRIYFRSWENAKVAIMEFRDLFPEWYVKIGRSGRVLITFRCK